MAIKRTFENKIHVLEVSYVSYVWTSEVTAEQVVPNKVFHFFLKSDFYLWPCKGISMHTFDLQNYELGYLLNRKRNLHCTSFSCFSHVMVTRNS